MRIDPADTLIGYPIVAIRDLLRKLVFDRAWVQQALKVDAAEADRVLRELAEARLICPLERPGMAGKWETTPDGTRLANASTLPSISREQADRIMKAFMARVQDVRSQDKYLYEVGEVVLFGSYLTDAPEVNDIDLIVRLRMKEKFNASYGEVLAEKVRACQTQGKTFALARNWFDYLQGEAMGHLKATSEYVSFHRQDTLALIVKADQRRGLAKTGTPSKVIYRASPPSPAPPRRGQSPAKAR
jgi:predicted nucleotidyltransferase